jgi:ADP-ribose pyrophosphatase YjhB (NUDIX family)
MRQAVRAIVVRNGYLLVMHRNRFGQQYYTLPGGATMANEQHEHALLRHLKEETDISILNPRLVIAEDAGDPYGMQYMYLCQYLRGEPRLDPQSEEAKISALGENLYSPQWLPLYSLASVPFKSETLKRALIEGLARGFPQDGLTINSKQEQ